MDLGALQVADPFEPRRNLVEADRIVLKLNPEALTEKKLVVERFALQGHALRDHAEDAGAAGRAGSGFAPQALRVGAGVEPSSSTCRCCQLTPIDTVRQLVLNPGAARHGAGGAGAARPHRLDPAGAGAGVQGARRERHRGLGARPRRPAGRHRSAQARPRRHPPGDPVGAADAQAARRSQAAGERARAERDPGRQAARARASQGLDEARKKDYAFARSLLKLPSFSAPDIGNAFFGKVSIDRFQQALYWAELARHYMPPGLLPREDPGPKRLRAVGHHGAIPQGARLAPVPDAGRAGGLQHRRRAAQGRLRGHGAGAHLGPGALRQADDRDRQADAPGRPSRGSTSAPSWTTAPPPCATRSPPGSAGCKLPSFDIPGPAVPARAGHRRRQPHLRAPRRPAPGPLVHRLATRWPGRSTARGHGGTIWSSSCGGWSPGSSSST